MQPIYESWQPKADTIALVARAADVIDNYHAQGYKLTLRQLYYQLVAANVIPNTQRQYARLSQVMTKARWAGLVDMDCLYDPGREPERPRMWSSPKSILTASAKQYTSDLWRNAQTRVELWAEKDAVASVLKPVAARYQVTYQSARGFMGLGAMADAAKRMNRYGEEGHEFVRIIYCGDHDSSGQEIPRVVQRQMDRMGLPCYVDVDVVALTSAQIDEYNPPPQPAKSTDARTAAYIEEHGHDDVWELDALRPDVLDNIASEAIIGFLPDDWDELRAADQVDRDRMIEIANNW